MADGATVPIFYEGRLPELRILGTSLDAVFDRVFADRSPEEREAIKKKYGTEAAIVAAPKRIQAISLDLSPLREHTLLQAIARVNRTEEGKKYGLIIDYWGVSEELQEALAIFAPADIQGALTRQSDELPRLQTRHAAAMRAFVTVPDKDDLDACVAVLAPETARSEFELAFKRFAQSLDLLLPDPRALAYSSDARWLGKIRKAAAALYRDARIDISDCGAKVKKLIEEAVIADGIQILVQRVSLFTPDFEKKMAALKSDEARASELEHALKAEIHERHDEDPAFYASLRERLEKILDDRKAKRIDAAQQLLLSDALAREARSRTQAAATLGLTETGLALYGLLVVSKTATASDTRAPPYGAPPDEAKRELATLLEEQLAPKAAIIDWIHKDEVQREMRQAIKRQLRAAGYPPTDLDPMATSVVELLKRRRPRG